MSQRRTFSIRLLAAWLFLLAEVSAMIVSMGLIWHRSHNTVLLGLSTGVMVILLCTVGSTLCERIAQVGPFGHRLH